MLVHDIISMYSNKETLKSIGAKYGRDKATIKRILIENDIKIRSAADTVKGRSHTVEHKNKISMANKGHAVSPTRLKKLRDNAQKKIIVPTPEQLKDMTDMYYDGETIGKIGEKYGYCSATIKRILVDNDVTIRPEKESRSIAGRKKKRFHHKIFTEQQRMNISKALSGRIVPIETVNKMAKSLHEKHVRELENSGLSLEDKKLYYNEVRALTEESYRNYKQIINPLNLERKRDIYQLDHIYSIADGLRNSVSPEIISHPCNLRMLKAIDNSIKGERSDIDMNNLLSLIQGFKEGGDTICLKLKCD